MRRPRQPLSGRPAAAFGVLLLGLLTAGCPRFSSDAIALRQPAYGAEAARIELAVASGLVDGSAEVQLDGRDVSAVFRAAPGVLRAELAIEPGPHMLVAHGLFQEGSRAVRRSVVEFFLTPPALPALLRSLPAAGDRDVPRGEWLRLEFVRDLPELAREGVELACDGERLAADVHLLSPRELVVNPRGELPAAARCSVAWRGSRGAQRIDFRVAGGGFPAVVHYDRTSPRSTAPFPDDFWLVRAPDRPEGRQLAVEFAGFRQPDQFLLDAFVADTRSLDGFSPLAHLVVPLSDAPDPDSLPHSPADSLDPLASVGLYDVDAGSASYGERVPFRLLVRSDEMGGAIAHALLIFPSIPLEPGGRYGLVVTRRARADAARPFEPSVFFLYARDAAPLPTDPPELRRARRLAGDVLTALERAAHPPVPREDVALAVRFTVRSTDAIPLDLLAMRADVEAAPPPEVVVSGVAAEDPELRALGSRVAAIVTGTWEAPDWRAADLNLARDPETGLPLRTGTHPVGFVAALPDAAFDGPVPVTFYQHGSPGSAEEEVVNHARLGLAEAGFAVVGFTDALNREVAASGSSAEERAQRQLLDLLLRVLLNSKAPDYFVETNGEQLAFLRAIEELGRYPHFAFDAPPPGLPERIHGFDVSRPLTYVGISEGANLAPALLPYAPEIRAAALVGGGRRFSETLIHQQADVFLDQLEHVGFGGLSATDVWVALALFQTIFDAQDAQNHAPFLYRAPLPVSDDPRRASVLLVEGLQDSFVPNHATESLAWALGELPTVEPERPGLPFAPRVRAPLAGNVDGQTTAGLVQFVPEGVRGLEPSAGCRSDVLAPESAREGHHCAQLARESLRQRAFFFESAVAGEAPVILHPRSH